MLTMSVNRWMVSLILCFIYVYAHDDQNKEDFCNQDMCETHKLRGCIGSTVLLPCTFIYNNISWVSWSHNGTDLLTFSDKYIEFRDPRDGRLNVYPNQHSQGNYSISIKKLELSDLGCYHCEHRHKCVQVELSCKEELLKTILIYIFGFAASIMLGVGGYCFIKYRKGCNKTTDNYVNNPASAGAVENIEPANTTRNDNDPPGGLHVVHRNASIQARYLNLDHFNLMRAESQRTYITVI